ncbi:MAG: hypothetical protein NC347_09370 [Clostridium sp.]|nr:hypothetical protein [Clostridium sp.]
MKISKSAVAMEGSSSYSRYQESKVTSILVRPEQLEAVKKAREEQTAADGVDVSISEKSQSMLEDLMAEKNKSAQGQQNKEPQVEQTKQTKLPGYRVSSKDEQMLKTLKRILEMLNKIRKKGSFMTSGLSLSEVTSWSADFSESSSDSVAVSDGAFAAGRSRSFSLSQSSSMANVIDLRSAQSVSNGSGTQWIRHTETSSFVMEQESATFSAQGIAKTADGREISFGVDLSMSRGFAGQMFSMKDEAVVLTDPLVINLENDNASITDQKFYFDLDSDGKEEEISQLGAGSGFLAYDKNGDGIINDGSELFGTKSGDGFADLAAYDRDGNGWIDENDDIFNKLKVWTKDADGNDKLLDLKEANVGAIYLGSANTQMHLNNAYTNQTNAVIRKTGVFLKETGEVGTIHHVDFAV